MQMRNLFSDDEAPDDQLVTGSKFTESFHNTIDNLSPTNSLDQ